MIENELRILEVDPEDIVLRLSKLGARSVGQFAYRRYVFDLIPKTENEWLRLRTDGVTTTLALKSIQAATVDGTEELETVVESFDTTLEVLRRAGLTPKGYEENRRRQYVLNSVEVSVDEWPMIPPYVELEGPDEAAIREVARALGVDDEVLTGKGVKEIYRHYGINLDDHKFLTFDHVE